MTQKPALKLAITLGDAAGIGPEVALKAISSFSQKKSILLLGPAAFYETLSKKIGVHLKFYDIPDPRESFKNKKIACYFPYDVPEKIKRGVAARELSTLAIRSIELAVRLSMEGTVQGIVTPPINKAAVRQAGFDIPGHTEFLAKLSKTSRYEMMLIGGPLRVALVTRHVPLGKVPSQLTIQRILETILMTERELKKSFGIRKPRIVVCGLNPHAGEKGHIGKEEIEIIQPAVARAKLKSSSKIFGPLSPDTVFYGAYSGKYDAEICMYHDQGLIPLKMISRGGGVNMTLGLPFVRTSPDHGTAYDIAPRFTADAGSMIEALKLAYLICANQKNAS